MAHGFLYLVAIIDWASRAVRAWRLSNTIDGGFCVEAQSTVPSSGASRLSGTRQNAEPSVSGQSAH
jgi:putative transposase